MKLTQITFSKINEEIKTGLIQMFQKAGELFSSASPFGQILTVITSLSSMFFMYLENLATEMSLYRAKNKKSIRGLVSLTGHDPSRAMSASGVLRFKLKTNLVIDQELQGNKFTIFNNTLIKNRTNGLEYLLKTGSDYKTFLVLNNNFEFEINVTQGKFQVQKFTSDGSEIQTFIVSTRGFDIEQFEVFVFVNGTMWNKVNHLYDMLPNDTSCWVRSTLSLNKGIDIIFGNGYNGRIPSIGSIIEIRYIISDGLKGNINFNKTNDWDIIEPIIDGTGTQVDLTKIFDIYISAPINFASDGENIEFTRNIAPFTSKNYVLVKPENYFYFLKRLGIFSYINAYRIKDSFDREGDRTIYLHLIPDLRNFISDGSNYFDLDESIFYLDSYEKGKIIDYLNKMGTVFTSSDFKIVDPKLSRYVIFITLVLFEDANDNDVRVQIVDTISTYFLNFNRQQRIPSSDLEREIEVVPGVDSVKVVFKSEKNESYHIAGLKEQEKIKNSMRDSLINSNNSTTFVPGYDSKKVLGIDPIMNDIIFENDETPIIRGGWVDRDGNRYNIGVTDKGFSSVNFFIRPIKSKRTIEGI